MNAIIEKPTEEKKSKRTTFDGRLFLKVKLKTLAAEAKIIRQEERKSEIFQRSLRKHRTGVVRLEARHTLLAYGFLRGFAYKDIEPATRRSPDWSKVEAMARKYGIIHERAATVPPQQEQSENEEMLVRFQAWRASAIQ